MNLIERDGNVIRLANDWLRREMDVTHFPTTTLFNLRPNGKSGANVWVPLLWPGTTLPYEAVIQVQGRDYGVAP